MKHDPQPTRIGGPLKIFETGFLNELTRQGYTPTSRLRLLHLIAHLSSWMEKETITPDSLSPHQLEEFLKHRRAVGFKSHLTDHGLMPFVFYLRQLGVLNLPPPDTPEEPVEKVLHDFREYLSIERGTHSAADSYPRMMRPFLKSRMRGDELDLTHLKAAEVTTFAEEMCPKLSLCQAKRTVTALRSFLRFLHLKGIVDHSLVMAVPTVPSWGGARLPKSLDAEPLERLLSSCNQGTAIGRRDFAVLTLLARLGLRACEIARLKLDDIGWRAGELFVRGKRKRYDQLPLPDDVGRAVTAYLRNGRPRTIGVREVFVAMQAPHNALSAGAVTAIVATAGSRIGLKSIGARTLRQTAATEMLRAGASLDEIGQVLRHRRSMSTAIYTKVDREALRQIAPPWPGGVA